MKPTRDYAAPLVALDQVLEIDEGKIRTAKAIAGNEPFFAGHYPEAPVYPGVFLLEAVNQAVFHYLAARAHASLRARLVRVQSVRFLSPLTPGDRLEVTCRCTLSAEQNSLLVQAECHRAPDKLAAQMKLRYALEERHASA